MPMQIATFLTPKGTNTYFLLEDKYIRGGLHSCVDHSERDTINPINRKPGMVAVTQNDDKLWILAADKVTWNELTLGGGGSTPVRQSLIHTTSVLTPGASEVFTLSMGKSCLLYELSTTIGPCEVSGYSEPLMLEANPYVFKALSNHLSDDGTTYLSDGTSILGRRYSILMNLEDVISDNIYWKIKNTGSVSSLFTLTLSFLPLE